MRLAVDEIAIICGALDARVEDYQKIAKKWPGEILGKNVYEDAINKMKNLSQRLKNEERQKWEDFQK